MKYTLFISIFFVASLYSELSSEPFGLERIDSADLQNVDPLTVLPLVPELPMREVAIAENLIARPSFELADKDLPIPLDLQPPAPQFQPAKRKGWIAISLSSLFPGLGHVYLGDMQTASTLAGSAGASLGIARYEDTTQSIRIGSLLAFQTASYYGMYAVCRDVRLFNGVNDYKYKMPMDSFADLSTAPFRWRVMKKPEVWRALLGSLAVAVGVSYCYEKFAAAAHPQPASSTGKGATLSPLFALPIGISEESFFRGFLQSELCESFSPTTAITLSSLAFGAAHIPNALFLDERERPFYYSCSLPLITLFGAYAGWLTHKNRSLQESVALHTWYDGLIFAMGMLGKQSASTGRPGFAVAIPF